MVTSQPSSPNQTAFESYNAEVDAAHAGMIWTHPAMTTYYRNSKGRVVVNMPWRGVEYWHLIRQPNFEDLVVTATTQTKPDNAALPVDTLS